MIGDQGNDSKKIWKAMKTVSGDSKRQSINKVVVNGVSLSETNDIVNSLNSAFINKIKKIQANMPSTSSDLLTKLTAIESP